MNIIGRNDEIKLIKNSYESEKSEFVAVYGRRRVGKTYLINNSLEDKLDFVFTGLYNEKLKTQLKYFCDELYRKTKTKIKNIPKTWKDAFDLLTEYLISLNKDKVVVFFDELPWMDTHKGDLLTAMSSLWNMWDSKSTKLKLFVCGSSTSWMINKLIGDKGGLYGRVGRNIYLAPFTLKETKDYFNIIRKANYSNSQILDLYMILGGIPYYLDMIDTSKSISKNIDDLFFKINSPLRMEYDFLFRSLFKETVNYKKVINALSKKMVGLTRNEISEITKLSGGQLTEILNNLRSCDFLRCYSSFGKRGKEKMYQLVDHYILFYQHFIDNDDGQNENYWTINYGKPNINSWSGYSFEIVCLNHINLIKKSLGINGINSKVYSWKTTPTIDNNGTKWDGAQIDIIIDRDDKCINLIEVKFSSNDYVIDKDYYKHLKDRMEIFKHNTKTKKTLINTFISTNGIKNNSYSDIVDVSIVLDDFFNV